MYIHKYMLHIICCIKTGGKGLTRSSPDLFAPCYVLNLCTRTLVIYSRIGVMGWGGGGMVLIIVIIIAVIKLDGGGGGGDNSDTDVYKSLVYTIIFIPVVSLLFTYPAPPSDRRWK